MDNDSVVLMSANMLPQSSNELNVHSGGNPLNPRPISPNHSTSPTHSTIDNLVSQPLTPIPNGGHENQTVVDGNVEAHIDFSYKNAIPPTYTNGDVHEQKILNDVPNGHNNLHSMNIVEKYDDENNHNEKSRSCCTTLNKLCLFLAILCFALFLVALAYIIANIEKLNGKYDQRSTIYPTYIAKDDQWNEPISAPYYNLTRNNFTVILGRRGAKIHDILIPHRSNSRGDNYRSIVLHVNNYATSSIPFGSVRFDPEFIHGDSYKLPSDYPFFNASEQNWEMHVDQENPNRVRFVYPKQHQSEVIYELLPNNELVISYIAYPMNDDRELLVDMTNYVYFNLRGYGDMSTHHLRVNASRFVDPQNVNDAGNNHYKSVPFNTEQAVNETKNFYFTEHYGIGKNFIAELSEKETGTRVRIFGDQAGVYIDPLMKLTEQINGTMLTRNGISIRPRQSPIHQYDPLFGEIRLLKPSHYSHTQWWQFEF